MHLLESSIGGGGLKAFFGRDSLETQTPIE
jgi:hypothetical protein